MSTYTQILYQIVFGTKYNRRCLTKPGRQILFRYIAKILKNKNCHLYQINGVEDHIHIVTHLHPSVALADLVKTIKLATAKYIRQENLFDNFGGWKTGYAAFTYSIEAKGNLIRYVQRQEEHHAKVGYRRELKKILDQNQVTYDEEHLP